MACATVLTPASADELTRTDAATVPRISTIDPLNGGYLIVNMHGMLFHPGDADIAEDLTYARWLGGSIVRVFATDSSGKTDWDGKRVGERIAQLAPLLRKAHLRLIVAFVNNHEAVPGEANGSIGWMDNYVQLLLPFYTDTWRNAYLQFVRDLVSTVQWYSAQDVIFGWELGNELHTPVQPTAIEPFITQASAAVRALDPSTPILPGTMGANHLEPGQHSSNIARWLYCEAPVDAYTLHAYDWVSRQRPGDMPIDWDLDNILSQPCPNGRALPVFIEELGTSRGLAGVYTASDESARVELERRQIAFVRQFPGVVGFGVWNGESPRLQDRTFIDTRRGLTSYGLDGTGGGSCYDPIPDPVPGARCQLEQILRGMRYVRATGYGEWTPISGGGSLTDDSAPVVGFVDPVVTDDKQATSVTISGWALDPSATNTSGVQGIDVFVGQDGSSGSPLSAQVALSRTDIPSSMDNASPNSGFSVSIPLSLLPPGTSQLTLWARTTDRGIWQRKLQVLAPLLGADPAPLPRLIPTPAPVVVQAPPIRAEVQWPSPNDRVGRSIDLLVLASDADRVDVFIEPDRDRGGRLVGSASATPTKRLPGGTIQVPLTLPQDQHTLYVHVSSMSTGQEQVIQLPVRVQ